MYNSAFFFVHITPDKFKNGDASNIFRQHYAGENVTIICHLDLCLRKTQTGKSHDYREAMFS